VYSFIILWDIAIIWWINLIDVIFIIKMIMNENIKKELFEMKYLFGYERGRVISEQALPMEEFEDVETDFVDVSDIDDLGDVEDFTMAGREVETPVRPDVDTPTKLKKPSTPYKPKPGPKPDPKARKRKGDMPDWLTFDELGIDFE